MRNLGDTHRQGPLGGSHQKAVEAGESIALAETAVVNPVNSGDAPSSAGHSGESTRQRAGAAGSLHSGAQRAGEAKGTTGVKSSPSEVKGKGNQPALLLLCLGIMRKAKGKSSWEQQDSATGSSGLPAV